MLWEKISSKEEIFAYVKNISMTGKYYWVLAHVTPTLNSSGEITGYHSTRRNIDNRKIEFVKDIYRKIKDVEQKQENPKKALEEGRAFLEGYLEETGKTYNEFIWS
jgi:hypothetical protein